MSPGRVLMVVAGCLVATTGLAMAVAGGAAAIVHASARDGAGFFRSGEFELSSPAHAVTSERLDLGTDPGDGDWLIDRGALGTVRLELAPTDPATAVFAGIGPSRDVEAYLRGVSHDRVVDFDESGSMSYERLDGEVAPGAPGEQPFWAAQVSGQRPADLTWEVESGDWTVVVMNADGSAGVDVDARAGIKLDWLLPVAIGILVGGVLLLAGGTVLAVFGTSPRRRHRDTAPVSFPTLAAASPQPGSPTP